MDGDDHAISYKLLQSGTAVQSADERPLGTVERVLDNRKENIFDGIVIATPDGLRFVDAPEIGRITNSLVTLTIDEQTARSLPEPDAGAPEFSANPKAGKLGRFFGGGWKKRQ